MRAGESLLPLDWFRQGDQDLEAAHILLHHDGPFPVIAFHLHQATEKYLKGYLLATGWSLRRIHDLEALVQEAIARDPAFTPFLNPCQEIAEFYIETRYPIGLQSPIPGTDLDEYYDVTLRLVSLVQKKTR